MKFKEKDKAVVLLRPCIGESWAFLTTILMVDESRNLVIVDWKQQGSVLKDGKLITEWNTPFDLDGIEWEEGKTSNGRLFPREVHEDIHSTEYWIKKSNDWWTDEINKDHRRKRRSVSSTYEFPYFI